MSLTIATWNLHTGRATDHWREVLPPADIVFLQEAHDPGEGALWREVPSHRRWGSAVFLRQGRVEPLELPGWEGWVVGGEVAGAAWTSGRRVFVFSLHAPSSSKAAPRRSYPMEVRGILDALAERLPEGAALVLGGDFNFLSLGPRQPGEEVEEKRAEQRALARIHDLGLVSCWVEAHPGEPLVQTLRWSRDPSKPFHCDGIFVPAAWAAGVECEVLTSERITATSDHNPVVARLQGAVQIELKMARQTGGRGAFAWLWVRALPSEEPRVSWPERTLNGYHCAPYAEVASSALEESGLSVHLVVDGFVLVPVDISDAAVQQAIADLVAHLRGEELPRGVRVWEPARPYEGQAVPLREGASLL